MSHLLLLTLLLPFVIQLYSIPATHSQSCKVNGEEEEGEERERKRKISIIAIQSHIPCGSWGPWVCACVWWTLTFCKIILCDRLNSRSSSRQSESSTWNVLFNRMRLHWILVNGKNIKCYVTAQRDLFFPFFDARTRDSPSKRLVFLLRRFDFDIRLAVFSDHLAALMRMPLFIQWAQPSQIPHPRVTLKIVHKRINCDFIFSFWIFAFPLHSLTTDNCMHAHERALSLSLHTNECHNRVSRLSVRTLYTCLAACFCLFFIGIRNAFSKHCMLRTNQRIGRQFRIRVDKNR